MTLAQQLLAKFPGKLSRSNGMAALKWMSIQDPNGLGKLLKAEDGKTAHIAFTMSDNSRVILDVDTQSFFIPNN